MNAREIFSLGILAVVIIFLGVYPSPVLNLMTASVNHLVDFVHKGSVGIAVMGQ